MPESPSPTAAIIRVAIIEDQRETREGLRTLVNGMPGYRCTGAFRSMEEAYNVGKGALEYWQQKTRRTHPPVDLAQDTPGRKLVDREPVHTGSLTSHIYR